MCAEPPARPSPEAARSRCVLVVDDNPVNQMVAALTLQKLGYTCTVARDGRRAVEAWASGEYCAILMDCQMPGMDGFEAAAAIRSREAGTRIPILAMTASDIPDDRRKCREAGMDGYLSKPLTTGKLVTALARVAAQRAPGDAPSASSHDADAVLDRPTIAALRELAGQGEPDPFPQIAQRFLNNASTRLARLIGGLPSTGVVGEAHSLRGMSGTIGARRLARLCGDLELEASHGKSPEGLIDEITFEFRRVRLALEQELHPSTACHA